MLTLRFALGRLLVLLVSTVALCVVGLVLTSRTTVFALLDGTAFRRDGVKLSVYASVVSMWTRADDISGVRRTSVRAIANTMASYAGRACPFLSLEQHGHFRVVDAPREWLWDRDGAVGKPVQCSKRVEPELLGRRCFQ